jgi:hypothetical protein
MQAGLGAWVACNSAVSGMMGCTWDTGACSPAEHTPALVYITRCTGRYQETVHQVYTTVHGASSEAPDHVLQSYKCGFGLSQP